jgi:hypothetical protein
VFAERCASGKETRDVAFLLRAGSTARIVIRMKASTITDAYAAVIIAAAALHGSKSDMAPTARTCLDEARAMLDRGEGSRAARRALTSLAYSDGVRSVRYASVMQIIGAL